MIKLIFCLKRLPNLNPAEFRAYWYDNHGPLVRARADILRIERYVQCHALDTPLNDGIRAARGAQPMYDGMAELWWRSEDDLNHAMTDPKALKAGAELLEDERKFIDLAGSSLTFTQERVVV